MSDPKAAASGPSVSAARGPAGTPDPFGSCRANGGYLGQFMGEEIPVLTNWRDLRAAAQDWPRFSNDAPGRVPIPAEDDVRSLRQLPIETDPPQHSAYKDLVKPWFRRPADHGPTRERISDIINMVLGQARGPVDVVSKIALPIQSHALAALLGLPAAEAEIWTTWGLHAFRTAGKNDPARAEALMALLDSYIDRAGTHGQEDFFAFLATLRREGQALTRDEMLGYAHVTFAGGRDTVIGCIAAAMAHLAETPADLMRLAEDAALVPKAVEEIVRHTSPLTHIGRVCTRPDTVLGHDRKPGERIALCFAAASHDPEIFEAPEILRIDRSPNPHVSFGSGDHNCLGSTHARAVLRGVLSWLSSHCARIEPVAIRRGIRLVGGVPFHHGFEELTLILHPKAKR